MTAEELDKLIESGQLSSVGPAFEGLSEKERRKLGDAAYKWYRQLRDGTISAATLLSTKRPEKTKNSYQTAALCVLATGNLRQASGVALYWYAGIKDQIETQVICVLQNRKPKWATRWLEKNLEGAENFFPWELTERLIAAGICEKPTTDDYIRHFGDRFNNWNTALRPRLKARPHLLEDEIWRLFEVRSNAFAHDPSKYHGPSKDFESWDSALAGLAQDGTISRSKLLDSAIAGLARDFTQNIYSGFLRMLKTMKPLPVELGERQQILRELLGSSVSHVSKFAISSLKKAPNLEKKAFLAAALPVMNQKVKGNAFTVLKFAEKLSKKDATLTAAALPLFEAGVYHAHVDVRERSNEWLKAHDKSPEVEVHKEEPVCSEDLSLVGIGEPWLTRLDLNSQRYPKPLSLDPNRIPILDQLELVEPIEDFQELIDTIARAVEEVNTGIEVERILGGLCRLCDQRPADFNSRTEALEKRVRNFQASEVVRGLVGGWGGLSLLIKHMLICWFEGSYSALREASYYKHFNLYPFVRARMVELSERVGNRRAAPLLSEPTHAHGWIEPTVLVRRMLDYPGRPGPADLILALFRMAPTHRQAALALAADYSGEFAPALRWALGAPDGPRSKEKHCEVWLAAARARQPRGPIAVGGLPQGATEGVPFDWTPVWQGTTYKFPRFQWSVDDNSSKPSVALGFIRKVISRFKYREELLPTVLMQKQGSRRWETPDFQGDFTIRWLGLLWPQNLDSYWRLACDSLIERLDIDTTASAPNFAYLDPLFELDRSWAELEHLALSVALISKDADVKGLGIDALIEGIEDGRAHPGPLGEVLSRLYKADFIKPNRLADSLADVARVGGHHKRFVAEIMSDLLAWPLCKNSHHSLQLMLEVSDGISEPVRQNLKAHKGGGKTAKLIKKLLDLGPPTTLSAFRVPALRARAERAVRYQACHRQVDGQSVN
jgi:hypothetical protein